MTKIKKWFGALAVALCGMPALAEGAGSSSFDFSSVTTNMESLKEALKTWGNAFMPVLIGIVAVFIGYWLLKFAIRLVKGMSSASK